LTGHRLDHPGQLGDLPLQLLLAPPAHRTPPPISARSMKPWCHFSGSELANSRPAMSTRVQAGQKSW
jgi:hypothetical protein